MREAEEWLDDRWNIYQCFEKRAIDQAYYEGALKAIELLGFDWKRDKDGEHKIYK